MMFLGCKKEIAQFDISSDSIRVVFTNSEEIIFNEDNTGSKNMKRLESIALKGQDLEAFINEKLLVVSKNINQSHVLENSKHRRVMDYFMKVSLIRNPGFKNVRGSAN